MILALLLLGWVWPHTVCPSHASGMLCCRGQGFHLLYSLYTSGVGRISSCQGQGSGWGASGSSFHLMAVWQSKLHPLRNKKKKHVQFYEWEVLYKSQLLLLLMLFTYWSHFFQNYGKKINQQIHFVYIHLHFQCLGNVNLLNTTPSPKAPGFS